LRDGGDPSETDNALENAYRDLAREVPHNDRQWDSVQRQIRLLATLLRRRHEADKPSRVGKRATTGEARGEARDDPRAVTLSHLADQLASLASSSRPQSGAEARKETP
jgi:hypothetical protein